MATVPNRPAEILPNPDPSELTTEQLYRGLADQFKLVEAKLEVVTTRLDAMDKAAVILSENVNRVPTLLDRSVTELKDYFGLQIASIQLQFKERDVRADKAEIAQKEFAAAQSVAAGIANTVALSAQKEQAAAQSAFFSATMAERQAATTKQIDAILTQLGTNIKATDDKIVAISARQDRSEGVTLGGHDTRTDQRLTIGSVIGFIMAAVAVAGFLGFALHR